MKYAYKKSAVYGQYAFIVLEYVIMLLIYHCAFGPSGREMSRAISGCVSFFVTYIAIYHNELTNKSVELFDECIRFNNFRFMGRLGLKTRKALSYNVNYKNIVSITAKKLPLIGVWSVSVDATNVPQKRKISIGFENHKELTATLCRKAREYNPDVLIDDCLAEYCEG